MRKEEGASNSVTSNVHWYLISFPLGNLMSENISTLIRLLTTGSNCLLPGHCPPDSWTFPLFLVWWSIILITIALGAGFHLGWQTNRLRRTFLRLTNALQRIRTSNHSLTRTGLEKIEGILGNEPLTKAGWDEFKETLLREEKGSSGEISILNTRPATEFFPYAETEQYIAPYHRLMPVLLTSAGLLGTFFALLIGLHGVHVNERLVPVPVEGQAAVEPQPQSDQPSSGQSHTAQQPQSAVEGIDGIGTLINSLSGKFLSSIIALILSISYAVWEAWHLRRTSDIHHKFCVTFDALFIRRTPESLLQKIHQEVESQSSAFRHFNTDLSGYLKQSFQESLGPTLTRLTEALEKMTGTNEERIVQLVESLIDKFQSNLRESTGQEFQNLTQSLRQTAELLQAMNTQRQSTQDGLESLLTSLNNHQQQQNIAADEQRQATQKLFTQIAQQVQGVASQSNANLEQTVTRILTNHAQTFEQKMGTLLSQLDKIVVEMGRSTQSGTEQLATSVNGVVTRLGQTVTETTRVMQEATTKILQRTENSSEQLYDGLNKMIAQLLERQAASSNEAVGSVAQLLTQHMAGFEEKIGMLFDRLHGMTAEMSRSTEVGSERLSKVTTEITERLGQEVTEATNTMGTATKEVLQQLGAVSARLNDQVKQLLDQQLQQMRATDAASQSLGQATERVRSLVQDSGEAFGQVRPIISDLAHTAREMRATGEGAHNAQGKLQQVSEIFSQQGTLLKETTDHYTTHLNQFGSVFKIIEQGLGNILQQLGEEMRRYQEVSKTSLREQLQDFDTHLANNLRQIKVSIEGINPGLEDLAEAIDGAMKHVGSNGKRG